MISSIPKKLSKCPLVDALIEIRFEASVPNSAVFGMIYSHLKDNFPGNIINLPVSQLPEQIREKDPNLKFRPLYRIESSKVILQIGTNVISVSSIIPYIGWNELSSNAEKVIDVLIKNEIINRVTRLGHRYINFFSEDVLPKLELYLKKGDTISKDHFENTYIRTTIVENNFTNLIQIMNDAHYGSGNSNVQEGSIIDIDSFCEYEGDSFLVNYKDELLKSHKSEKKVFFSLLNRELIESLEPEELEDI